MSRRIVSAAAAALIVFLGATSCSTGEREQPRPTARTPSLPHPAQPVAAAPSARAYFDRATALDLFQLRAADLAILRGGPMARNFAIESKRQHNAIAAQLSFAGRYLNMLPSRVLPPYYQGALNELVTTADFDAAYLARERRLCGPALKLHRDFARSGESPTLRPVARFAVTAIQSECKLLDR